jgi:ribosomal protein L16
MTKAQISTIKKRPFKVWVRNKRYSVNFYNGFSYIPVHFNSLYNISFNESLPRAIRYRRIVVKSLSYSYISSNSIEAFRKVLAPYFRKKDSKNYKFLIRCYSFLPLTKKPAEVRMGGGKGSKVRSYISPVRPGQILFEVLVRDPISTKKILKYASKKLSVTVAITSI